MPFFLLIVGIVILTSAIRNTQNALVTLIKADFTGPGNFLYWVLVLIVIGAIGYVEKLKAFSDALLVLIIVALFLSRGSPTFPGGGFFQQLSKALGGTIGDGIAIGGGVTTIPGTTPGTIPVCVPSQTTSCVPGDPNSGIPTIRLPK